MSDSAGRRNRQTPRDVTDQLGDLIAGEVTLARGKLKTKL